MSGEYHYLPIQALQRLLAKRCELLERTLGEGTVRSRIRLLLSPRGRPSSALISCVDSIAAAHYAALCFHESKGTRTWMHRV